MFSISHSTLCALVAHFEFPRCGLFFVLFDFEIANLAFGLHLIHKFHSFRNPFHLIDHVLDQLHFIVDVKSSINHSNTTPNPTFFFYFILLRFTDRRFAFNFHWIEFPFFYAGWTLQMNCHPKLRRRMSEQIVERKLFLRKSNFLMVCIVHLVEHTIKISQAPQSLLSNYSIDEHWASTGYFASIFNNRNRFCVKWNFQIFRIIFEFFRKYIYCIENLHICDKYWLYFFSFFSSTNFPQLKNSQRAHAWPSLVKKIIICQKISSHCFFCQSKRFILWKKQQVPTYDDFIFIFLYENWMESEIDIRNANIFRSYDTGIRRRLWKTKRNEKKKICHQRQK